LILVVLVLIAGLILSGCTSTSSSPSTPPTPAASTQSSPPPSQSTPAANKTLKIGIVAMFGSATSLDFINAVKLMAEVDNQNGGLTIGGDKYNIQILDYDNNNSQTTEVAAINRLVYQDEAKYILAQGTFESAWLPVTEQNKVIVMNANVNYDPGDLPMYKYSFNACGGSGSLTAITGWFAKNYSQEIKSFVMAFPDNQLGHVFDTIFAGTWKAIGVNPTVIYFPASQEDLSSIGTKVVSLNPALFSGMAGGAVADISPISNLSLKESLSPQALEGFTCQASPCDFDPPLTQASIDFKAAWIAKYGKWEGLDLVFAQNYEGLKAALIQAGSIDTDKVAAVFSNGLKFDSLSGPMQMISRPDLGNDRTIDSLGTYYVKTIHNGNAELVGTINPDEALGYLRLAFPPLPPGATPPGLPPPSP
jgi:hypothetical protein